MNAVVTILIILAYVCMVMPILGISIRLIAFGLWWLTDRKHDAETDEDADDEQEQYEDGS